MAQIKSRATKRWPSSCQTMKYTTMFNLLRRKVPLVSASHVIFANEERDPGWSSHLGQKYFNYTGKLLLVFCLFKQKHSQHETARIITWQWLCRNQHFWYRKVAHFQHRRRISLQNTQMLNKIKCLTTSHRWGLSLFHGKQVVGQISFSIWAKF